MLILRSDNFDPKHGHLVYSGVDSSITIELYNYLKTKLNPQQQAIYQQSLALRAPLLGATFKGMKLDLERRESLRRELRAELEKYTAWICQICSHFGFDYNHKPTVAIRGLFSEGLNLPAYKKRRKSGEHTDSYDKKALQIYLKHDIGYMPALILLEIRIISKALELIETKLDADKRFRSSFNITGTVTGRLSSSKTVNNTGGNTQNINRNYRDVFIPDEGHVIVDMDLQQADSRNIGATCYQIFGSEGSRYLDTCESEDLHSTVVNMVWGSSQDPKANFYRSITHRDIAKIAGHGTNYVGTPQGLEEQTGVPRKLLKEFQDAYFAAFPEIKALHKWATESLLRYPPVFNTFVGRSRYFWDKRDERATLRRLVSFLGQSPTADQINIATLKLVKIPHVQILNQVHDSLVCQIPIDKQEGLIPLIRKAGTVNFTLNGGRSYHVPVDVATGYNWGKHNPKFPDENPGGLREVNF